MVYQLSITRDQLASFDPCDLPARLKLFGKRKRLTARQAIAAGASIRNVLWVMGRVGRKDLCVRFALACAQRVAHLNPDPRVQAALDATSAWLADPTEEKRLATRNASAAATSASATSAATSAAQQTDIAWQTDTLIALCEGEGAR